MRISDWSSDVCSSDLVCDIDHFKTINDAHGHALGDRVIVALARILMEFAPADAITARFGGEEFIMFLPDADAARAATTANDIRESVAREDRKSTRLNSSH